MIFTVPAAQSFVKRDEPIRVLRRLRQDWVDGQVLEHDRLADYVLLETLPV